MQSINSTCRTLENVIVTDGCIDLIVDPSEKRIGFSGMSATHFHYEIHLPIWFFGARLGPGVFRLLTGHSAADAMDRFLPLVDVDRTFNPHSFFSLSPEKIKMETKNILLKLMKQTYPNTFTELFNKLCNNPPANTTMLADMLHFSPRQCQRLFKLHFGFPPKLALSILRFQKCLKILCSGQASPADILNLTTYYDQSHMIKDFQKNLGITPFQLIHKYPPKRL